MSLLDRVRSCHRRELGHFRPFCIGPTQLGWVRHDFAEHFRRFPKAFEVAANEVRLAPDLDDFDRRSTAVAEAFRALAEEGVVTGWRDEDYAVASGFYDPPLMRIERAGVPKLGVRAYGVHVNGYVGRGAGLRMWIGRRSKTKPTAPGKLDHVVAGGQPIGVGLLENVIKECKEEASMPAMLAGRAQPTGFVSYLMENEEGMRNDILFTYDLELPADFVPLNTDGEIDEFFLWPVERVVQILADTDEFKFNVALVIIDFLVRHGLLTPDDSDYIDIVAGLRSA